MTASIPGSILTAGGESHATHSSRKRTRPVRTVDGAAHRSAGANIDNRDCSGRRGHLARSVVSVSSTTLRGAFAVAAISFCTWSPDAG